MAILSDLSLATVALEAKSILLQRVVLLVAQVPLHRVRLDHLQVFQDQRTAVSLCIFAVVLAALAQRLVGHTERLCANPLFSEHRLSRLVDIGEALVVNIVKGDEFWPLVAVVVTQSWVSGGRSRRGGVNIPITTVTQGISTDLTGRARRCAHDAGVRVQRCQGVPGANEADDP